MRSLRLLVPRRSLHWPGSPLPRLDPFGLAPAPVDPGTVLVGHRHPASQIDYTTPTHPDFATVANALDYLFFVAMTASLSGGGTAERGQSIASVNLAWSISKAISAQHLSGPGVATPALGDRAAIAAGPFTTDTTWSLTATSLDGNEVTTATTTQRFLSRRHWGTASAETLDDTDLLALLSGELATARQQTRAFTAADEYIWFAWPAEFGAPEFWVGGLRSSGWIETVRSHTNQYGHARSYRLYRSQFRQHGSNIGVEVR